jgi:type II secretory pathway pseudopilin PulG
LLGRRAEPGEAGFGLVEIVVSMLILALLSMALLPVLVQGMQQSVKNSTLATAVQLANDRIRAAQSQAPVCVNVATAAGVKSLTDDHGVTLQATTTVGTCPTGTGTVSVSTTVVRTDSGAVLTSASTLVLVS